jgi:anti-sigma-K factor RskA
MSPTHSEQALAAAYVLGALDADEQRAFEAHLRQCAVCADEVRSLQRVTEALARSVPQRMPRPELRPRVLAAAAATVAAPLRQQPSRPSATPWLQLAAALVLIAGLGGYAWHLQRRVADLAARLEVAEQRASAAERGTHDAQAALAVLAAPDSVRVDLTGRASAPGASARAWWSRQRGMVFTTVGLPPAPAGRVYQVWVVTRQAPVSAGLLAADPSAGVTAFFHTPADIAPPVAVAVTLEPAGGVTAPTGEMYLMGTPAL